MSRKTKGPLFYGCSPCWVTENTESGVVGSIGGDGVNEVGYNLILSNRIRQI